MSTEDTKSACSLNPGDAAVISALASSSSCPYAGLVVLWLYAHIAVHSNVHSTAELRKMHPTITGLSY